MVHMKTRYITFLGALLFLFGSCVPEAQDIDSIIPEFGKLVKVTAYLDNAPQTKTGLVDKEDGGKSVVWKSGNSISVFYNSGTAGGSKFTTSTNGPIAEFLGNIPAVSGDLSGVGGHAYFWGLYPYSETASCDGTAITTTLPDKQLAFQGDVADDLLVTVGRSENLSIHFKNACSVIGFTLTQENINKVVFSGNAGEKVAGEFKVSFDGSNKLVNTPTENAIESITITPAESETFQTGVTYYFATLPGTFSEGYSLAFTKADASEAAYQQPSAVTLKASTFYTMEDKDSDLIFSDPIPRNNVILYTSIDGDIIDFTLSGLSSNIYENGVGILTFDHDITEISESAFIQNTELTTIILPESVTSIGNSAFYDCSGLSRIDGLENVSTIDSYAFYGCSGLTTFIIPEGVKKVHSSTFSNCTGLTSVLIPDSVTLIGQFAFLGCTSLKSIVIPESVTSLGIGALARTGLTSITLPNSITVVPQSLFSGCKDLKTVVLPESITSLGTYVFRECEKLTSVSIPSLVTSIPEGFFFGCTGLTTYEIPDTFTSIGYAAFQECSGLVSIIIPDSVTSIDEQAFYLCSGLESIRIPDNVTTIGKSAFSTCTGLTSITIPEGVKSIGVGAFNNCTGLTSVTIPASLTSIGMSAFYNCSGLTSVTIPEGVTSIEEDAFRNCSGLTSISIPESVTNIGKCAFYGAGLTAVTIPKKVTGIGENAFYLCNLTSVTVLCSLPPVLSSTSTFRGSYPIYVPEESVETYKSSSVWSNYAARIQAIPE